jgi:carboxyl-terminal processing protease
MCWRSLAILTILGMAVTAAFANPDEPSPQGHGAPPRPAEAFVKNLWAVSDLVLDHDVDPPTRQEMMLGGIRALLQKAGAYVPADLSRRISTLSTEEDFLTFVRQYWPKDGVRSPCTEVLTTAMLQGLLHRVPGEPNLVPPKELKVVEQIRDNRYVGTGIQISINPKENRCQIIDPFRGGPARKAGAKPGDLILEVNGKSTEGKNVAEIVEMIRGEEGTQVTFVVRQPGATETRTLTMTRSVVPFETVVGLKRGVDDAWVHRVQPEVPVGYVQVTSITSSTLHELRQAASKLEAAGLRALVVDLRETHGDSIQQAALLADGLLDEGVLWEVRDAKDRVKEYRADRDCLCRGWPLAVLVGQHTGPAAGWVAQALRNNRGAILVGEMAHAFRYAKTLILLPEGQGAIGLRTGVVAFPKPQTSANPKEEVSQDVIPPDHAVKITAQQREMVTKWFHAKNLSQLHTGVTDEPPDDPQLAKAVEVLRKALPKVEPTQKTEASGGKGP